MYNFSLTWLNEWIIMITSVSYMLSDSTFPTIDLRQNKRCKNVYLYFYTDERRKLWIILILTVLRMRPH